MSGGSYLWTETGHIFGKRYKVVSSGHCETLSLTTHWKFMGQIFCVICIHLLKVISLLH